MTNQKTDVHNKFINDFRYFKLDFSRYIVMIFKLYDIGYSLYIGRVWCQMNCFTSSGP